MLQLWAVLLGFGYAGVPLLAQILDSVVGGAEAEQGGGLAQAGALFTMELVVVLAVRGLLRRRGASEEGSVLVPRDAAPSSHRCWLGCRCRVEWAWPCTGGPCG